MKILLLVGMSLTLMSCQRDSEQEVISRYKELSKVTDLSFCKGISLVPRGEYYMVFLTTPDTSSHEGDGWEAISWSVQVNPFRTLPPEPKRPMTAKERERILKMINFRQVYRLGGIRDYSGINHDIEFRINSEYVLVKNEDPKAYNEVRKIYPSAQRLDKDWYYYKDELR